MRDAPPPITVESGRGAVFLWLSLAAALAGGAALFFLDPSQHGFYPRCFFKMATGLDCPGCGGLRATHQLLHGHLAAAFALNPLYILTLPIAGFFFMRSILEQRTGRKWPRLFQPATSIWLGAGIVIAFGVLRNLPWHAWIKA